MAQQKRKSQADVQRRMVFDQMLVGVKVYLTDEGKVFLRGDKFMKVPTGNGGKRIVYGAKNEVIS